MASPPPTQRAFYFGFSSGGHGFCGRARGWNGWVEIPSGCPWDLGLMDSGLLKNRKVPDAPDGRVYWTCGGSREDLWFAFFWWDRSGDKRGASNSGFYVGGFPMQTRDTVKEAAAEAFAIACEQWPEVVARQLFPLVLVHPLLGGAPAQGLNAPDSPGRKPCGCLVSQNCPQCSYSR